jgi:outer membrane lipoprotein-sorting protein
MILLRTYKKGFNLKYIGESTAETGRPAYDIQLTSKTANDIEKIDMQIEKASSLPVRLTVYMKNGMRSLIRIKNIQTGLNQPDTFFKFNPADFPDAIEIDLR